MAASGFSAASAADDGATVGPEPSQSEHRNQAHNHPITIININIKHPLIQRMNLNNLI